MTNHGPPPSPPPAPLYVNRPTPPTRHRFPSPHPAFPRTPVSYTLYAPDGRLALNIGLFSPTGVAVDPTQTVVYIADVHIGVVLAVRNGKATTTFAGRYNQRGFAGDGGPATAALLLGPKDLAVAPNGDLYILDGNFVRVVGGWVWCVGARMAAGPVM